MTHAPFSSLRALVEAEVERQVESLRYREPQMLAHGLRKLMGEDLKSLPAALLIEDEREHAGPEDKNRFRVSSHSLLYINDHRKAILLERWCDRVLACPPRDGAKEVSLLWKSAQEFEAALSERYLGQMANCEARLVGVLQGTAASLENGDDYLVVLWNWMRTPSSQNPDGKPRLVHMTDRTLVADLCRTCLNRDLVLPDEVDEVLRMSGLSAVRALLSQTPSKQAMEETLDDLLEPKEAAKLLGITVATLNNKKSQGHLPASVYIQPPGSRIKYRRKALLAWHRGQTSARRPRR